MPRCPGSLSFLLSSTRWSQTELASPLRTPLSTNRSSARSFAPSTSRVEERVEDQKTAVRKQLEETLKSKQVHAWLRKYTVYPILNDREWQKLFNLRGEG